MFIKYLLFYTLGRDQESYIIVYVKISLKMKVSYAGVRRFPLGEMEFERYSSSFENLRLTNTGKTLMLDLGFLKDDTSFASCGGKF